MKQEYFVLVLAHSLRGRLRRVHIPHSAVYAVLGLALLGCFSAFGIIASYGRMALKVANYNNLKKEADNLRDRYQNLQKVVNDTQVQMASLQMYAKEITVAYGIKQRLAGPTDVAAEGKLIPTFAESLADFNYLRSAEHFTVNNRRVGRFGSEGRTPMLPSLWPVQGTLLSPFAARTDPFSGEGAFHKGVDIKAAEGTVVHAAADGIITTAEPVSGGYGRLIVVDHGGSVQTYYAHLSKILVHAGQEVHRGDTLGLVGSSGRATAPHLHYEVRIGGAPLNPYRYLANSGVYRQSPAKDLPF
jgi:murein DD-endopeptidase MepM/ murein hydrolase activator NlpD